MPQPLMPQPLMPQPTRVLGRRHEAGTVWTLEIEPPAGLPAGGFAAGQFNMVYVFGVGEAAISISGPPGEPGPLIHTVRAVGPVSRAITELPAGAAVGLRGPYGTAWPVEAAAGRDVLLVAGGLGLAPLRPALYQILAARERFGRVALLYGTRSPQDIVFGGELEAWRRRGDLQVEVTVDHAAGDWRGSVGVVTSLIPRVAFDPSRAVALVCGPEVMMRFAAGGLIDAGLAPDRIHLSLERNMKCAIAQCGHCQMGPAFVCREGPVMPYPRLQPWLKIREA